jgi:hypothetical protein
MHDGLRAMTGARDDQDAVAAQESAAGLLLEVRLVSAEPPRGRIRAPGQGAERDFHGWIDFMGRIHELVDEAASAHAEGGSSGAT